MILRVGAVLLTTLFIAAFLQWRYQALTNFINEQSTALNLAVARIAVAATLLWQVRLHAIVLHSSLNPVLRVPFKIWGRFAVRLIGPPALTTAVYGIFLVSASLMLIGLFGRVASAASGAGALYLISPLFLFGKVDHIYHHLIFFCLICALFPSSDALSIDAFLAARRRGELIRSAENNRSLAYGRAMQFMWLFIGLAYYFPGLWKLSRGWMRWFSGKTLQDNIALAGDWISWTPSSLWFLRHTASIRAASVLVVIFELGFVIAILFPRLRPLAGSAGLAFHTAIYLVLRISFVPLVTCYVIFFDWSAITSRFRRSPAPTKDLRPAEPPPIALALPVAALTVMAILGMFHVVDTWPLSCYPAFDGPTSDSARQLSVQLVDAAGAAQDWNLTVDPRLHAAFKNWQWLSQQGAGAGSSAKARTEALIRLWMLYHPELHPSRIIVFRDRYQMRPLEGTRIRLARNKTWEFPVYPH